MDKKARMGKLLEIVKNSKVQKVRATVPPFIKKYQEMINYIKQTLEIKSGFPAPYQRKKNLKNQRLGQHVDNFA